MNGKIDKMSDIAASVIMRGSNEVDPEKLKQEITKQLDTMLANGEISKEDYKAGIKLTNKNSIMNALAGQHKTEGIYFDSIVHGFEDLENDEANTLMKSVGLDIATIVEIARGISKGDYTVHNDGLKQIRIALNQKIKEQGVDYELSKKETQLLVESVGINVKRGNILLNALSFITKGTERKTERAMDKLAEKAEKGANEYAEKHANDKVLTVMNEDLDKTIQKYEAQGAKVIKVEENILYTVIRVTLPKTEEE